MRSLPESFCSFSWVRDCPTTLYHQSSFWFAVVLCMIELRPKSLEPAVKRVIVPPLLPLPSLLHR